MAEENEGICQYELDRLARIAENKKRMQVFLLILGSCPNSPICRTNAIPQQSFACTGIVLHHYVS